MPSTAPAALLRQAVAKGYKDAAHMKKNKDFDALRDRVDFKRFAAELEAKKEQREQLPNQPPESEERKREGK